MLLRATGPAVYGMRCSITNSDGDPISLYFFSVFLFPCPPLCLQSIMAGDMMLLMRGLAKLSQAVVETQSSMVRNGTGEVNMPVYFLNLNSTPLVVICPTHCHLMEVNVTALVLGLLPC